MPDLLAGTRIQAADWPAAFHAADDTAITNSTNTTYVTGTPIVSLDFRAPTSGRVLLIVGLGAGGFGGDRIIAAIRVFEGLNSTGPLVLPPNGAHHGVISPTPSTYGYWSRLTLLEGLTPQAVYSAEHVYRIPSGSSGNADIQYRDISVQAVP